MRLGKRRRSRPDDRRCGRVAGQVEQAGQGRRSLRLAGVQGRAVLRSLAPGLAIPPVHGTGRPLWLLVRVALSTGVRAAKRDRQVWAGYAHAVILPGMDHHVVLGRHVAGDTLRALAVGLMLVVLRGVELGGAVAARA
jgi:hypothetical protein